MRKIFIFVFFILFITGCSNIDNRKDLAFEKECIYLYENWKLEELSEKLKNNTLLGIDDEVIQKYETLLEKRVRDRENFSSFIEELKLSVYAGDSEKLKNSIDSSLRGYLLEKEIKNFDFSKVNVLISKPVFYKNEAKSLMAFNIQTSTVYFDVTFSLKNGEWKIVNFKERRG